MNGFGLSRPRRAPNIDDEYNTAFATLQDELIMSDVSVAVAAEIVQTAQATKSDESPVRRVAAVVAAKLRRVEASLELGAQKPFVMMVMGVNGGGKTTTIAKLCRYFAAANQRVLLAAGDTFRAAAGEQLGEWATRAGAAKVISGNNPGAVAFDGVRAGMSGDGDVVLIDTAGRLPTQKHLMAELGKIRRAVNKALPGAPHELLLVADATLGRNVISQIEAFSQAAGVTGLALSKLDGSAKGGFLLDMAAHIPRPVRFVGFGEQAEDLAQFDAEQYSRALVGLE